jgi:murein DD-endopeptidase MepM/ murein hydrolase activator NlpD
MGDTIRTLRLISFAAVAALSLAACARNAPPAPVEVKGQQNYGRASSLASVSRSGMDDIIVVQRGDTLYGLARRHNVPPQQLIAANSLRAPYGLQVGQRLNLPHAQPARAVPTAPAVQAVETIPAGSVPPAVPAGKVESAPLAPISSAPAADRSIASAPASPPAVTAEAAHPAAAEPAAKPVVQAEASAEPKAAEAPTPAQSAALRRQMAEVEPASAALPARAGSGFIWPVRGRVVSDFGSKGGGLHNDGINIAASRGTPIRAAENGVVVYAGNELRGFGNLVLLRHVGGWMTAYGHADALTVERGDQVKRGQTIGRVGATGNVTSPQVHFEIRRGSRPVNPHDHLLSESASAD